MGGGDYFHFSVGLFLLFNVKIRHNIYSFDIFHRNLVNYGCWYQFICEFFSQKMVLLPPLFL